MPLEDHIGDIVGKSRAGLGVAPEDAARAAGITPAELEHFETTGQCASDLDFGGLGRLLNMPAQKLAGVASGWEPPETPWADWRHLRRVSSRGMGMEVHAYMIWDPADGGGALFDTGFDAGALLDIVQAERIDMRHLFITHTHRDHIAVLQEIRDALPDLQVHAGTQSAPANQRITAADVFNIGSLSVEARPTPGHAEDGVTFVISDWPNAAPKVAIVGDAIFAGSMGGARNAFSLAREKVRDEILTLPKTTLICPGHGPATTVGLEKDHNPFF